MFHPLETALPLPVAFNDPLAVDAPPAIALHAAERLRTALEKNAFSPLIDRSDLHAPGGGKMFGVLVVEDAAGRVGYLQAFSGQASTRAHGSVWRVPGFVPPVFDAAKRAAIETPGDALVRELSARVTAWRDDAEAAKRLAAWRALDAERLTEMTALRATHADRKHERQRLRDAGESAETLARLSQTDTGEWRRVERRWRETLAVAERPVAAHARRLRALERLRRIVCSRFQEKLFDTYVLTNSLGETRGLRDCHAATPPSGTGDCAAPKLLQFAFRNGLRPLAIAEFWFGHASASGDRTHAQFYPACRSKCGPLLPFMLQGLAVDTRFAPPPRAASALAILHVDAHVIVVDKAEGLLAVPGKASSDSVVARLRAQFGEVNVVHRLDLDTSGLMVFARDAASHRALQRQFAERSIDKRYIACVEGHIAADQGVIALPLRMDHEQRPRQIVDRADGKSAHSEYTVLERREQYTRLALVPKTGRTHQLRVHAAHPAGLGAPIRGDRLYGHAAERLYLHAERLAFSHPTSGERLAFESPAPF